MEYKVDGIIKFYPTVKLKLDTTLGFSSPSGTRITLNSTNDNDLVVEITLEVDSEAAAKEMAEIELNRISNLLSYFYDIQISGSSITGMGSVSLTPEGKHITTGEVTIGVDVILSLVKDLEPKSVEKLGHHLETEYPADFEDIASMWREAISTESPALKYLLLYRLMEFLFKSDTKTLTDWIKAKEPSVQIIHDRQRGDTTIYTHLRDNIHPKQKKFPLDDINNLLPKLQSLVKDAIEEKFGYNYAL
jgi:hypothetical protein